MLNGFCAWFAKNAPIAEQIGADRWHRWEKKMKETKQLLPGRELDLLVAEKVMGLTTLPFTQGTKQIGDYIGPVFFIDNRWKPLPYYSTDIGAAWEVVEKMKEEYAITIETVDEIQWSIWLSNTKIKREINTSLPHAICKVALAAKVVSI